LRHFATPSQFLSQSARRFSKTGLVPLLLVVALGSGCDRCKGKDTKTPEVDGGAATGPVIVTPDGGKVTTGVAINEETAGKVAGPIPKAGKLKAATPMAVTCKHPGQAVSPTIFGIAWADTDKDIGATAHRWGGNTTSRYNWKLGNAWSTANDWFWENVEIDSWEKFVGKAADKGGLAAITVPMLGWVAKDTTSCAFPTSKFPHQEKTDEHRPACGNGKKPDGKTPIPPEPDPSRWNAKMTPEEVGQWVAKIRAADKARGKRVVYEYILDNEPGLWDSTHRDVHPEPMTYDELLEKTIAYGTAVRKADPEAIIAGPAEWGWPNYFYSGLDMKVGHTKKPDRKAHGDEPILGWYLKKLAEHEKKTGVRILDVLDVHIYPQGDNVQGPDEEGGDGAGKTDRATNDLRFRTTRSLWDREYKDESWIDDAVYLIPRMKDLIAQNYPGRGVQIGEYNFGAEQHVAGAVALAEALGRFALYGLSHAFYWTFPKKPKPAYWAFRAYRNYDGAGGHFLDRIVPSSAPSGTSLYASRDEAGKKWVLVAINFSADRPFDASIGLDGCTGPKDVKSFVYTGSESGFTNGEVKLEGTSLKGKLPPYSITVIELTTS
jgi:glycosyl hydrolase family 44